MDFSDFSLVKIDSETNIKPFDCGDADLNEFLTLKAKNYKAQLLATTYVLENDERTIAFFSIFNDSVRVEAMNFASKSAFKRLISSLVPHGKRHLEYFPALKIGRLAVCNKTQTCGIGKAIVSYIIDLAIRQNETVACKLISVDAYEHSLGFYTKIGFHFFTDTDAGQDTRQMYFDLTPIINTVKDITEKNQEG